LCIDECNYDNNISITCPKEVLIDEVLLPLLGTLKIRLAIFVPV
jgi:hypothetical protein